MTFGKNVRPSARLMIEEIKCHKNRTSLVKNQSNQPQLVDAHTLQSNM